MNLTMKIRGSSNVTFSIAEPDLVRGPGYDRKGLIHALHGFNARFGAMDVDLLRPGTVPISPDTSLWFEFLLDPTLLQKHLHNNSADPTPTELITRFLTISSERPDGVENGFPPRISRRAEALKILALKVASHLKWDLDVFETKLLLSVQATLFKDFLWLVSPTLVDVSSHQNLDFSRLDPQALFAIFVYHRWVLKAFVSSMLNGKTKPNGIIPENGCEEVNEAASEKSVEVLKRMADFELAQGIVMPSVECFTAYTENDAEVTHLWELGVTMSKQQFLCQVLMDVASYLMFRESYREARICFKRCHEAFFAWKSEPQTATSYCTVTKELISGYCIAVGIRPPSHSPSLVHQFHSLLDAQYINTEKVLERDNTAKEIALMYRDSLELDINSEVASGKVTVYRDGLLQIQASNMVRRALDGGSWISPRVTPYSLHKALLPVIPKSTETELGRLKYLVGDILVNGDLKTCREMMELSTTKSLLTPDEINSAVESDYTDPIPHVLGSQEVVEVSERSPRMEVSLNERVLISSYDPHDIKTSINKIMSHNPAANLSKLSRNWEIPIPLNNVVMALQGGWPGLQHYCFILLAKSYELDTLKNFGLARTFMRTVIDEVTQETGPSSKLAQLVHWEMLLIDIHQFQADWPAKKMDWTSLAESCKGVLYMQNGEANCLPRIALKEECALTLLNTGNWSDLIKSPPVKHSVPTMDLYQCIAVACEDMNKCNRKVATETWDKLLPMFMSNQKRRDTLSGVTQSLTSILELNALAIVVSFLSKLHNLLNDQPQLDLYVQLTQLWPSNTIKNSSQYSIKHISEILMEVLEHALSRYPNNVPWLKLMGDLHFVNGHHVSSIRSYLVAAIAATDYFTRPLLKNGLIEDHIYKRMIKSCTSLQCLTQAGVLCQFLEEVDYSTAFKSLSEPNCSDSMDSYYDCIWDVNILEFLINLHTKRGENLRKQKVIRTVGLLELNSNNNEEIKREAENIRKSRFLRAMAAQYL